VRGEWERGEVLHAATAAGPVAVVEFETFALEDEGAYAVLVGVLVGWSCDRLSEV